MSAAVALRPASDDDRSFQARLYASTRQEELAPVPWTEAQKAAFLSQQFHAQSEHYARHYAGATFDIVTVDGARAGRLIVFRGERDVRIVDIALLPEFRGRGIGAGLLRRLFDEADRLGKVVSIHVEHQNPARRLYVRLGFASVSDEGAYVLLERQPKTAS